MNPLTGLIAATYTPFDERGQCLPNAIPAMVKHLLADGVNGVFVCGSTGEGMSLTGEERRRVTAKFFDAVAGEIPVIVHVGHNSVAEARSLAAHAEQIGADAVSATSPSYFKPGDLDILVDCAAEIAGGAPNLPFYYYHIPALTGVGLDMVGFVDRAKDRIPNLAGLKYTAPLLHEFQACRSVADGRFDVLWGCDEMLLGALATGARGAIGSTFNIAAPAYHRLISAFESGNLDEARQLQNWSVNLVRTVAKYPFHPAMKHILRFLGVEVGTCRLPLRDLSADEIRSLRTDLDAIHFFEARTDVNVLLTENHP